MTLFLERGVRRINGRCSSLVVVLAASLLLSACGSVGPERVAAVPRVKPAAGTLAGADKAEAGKGDAQQRFAAALQLMRDGERDQAREALVALCRDFPQFSGPPTDLGILYAQSKQRGAAIESFKKAVAANARNTVALNWLGVLYRETGDFARAETAYQQAISAKPDEAAAYLNLAILYDVSMRRTQDALAQYRRYQQVAQGKDSPMVAVWIKELEMRGSGGGAVAAIGAAQK